MDKTIAVTITLIILAGFLFWGFQTGFFVFIFSEKPVVIPVGIILFYGDGCPHCKNVDDFITANKIEEKVEFTKLEVWYSNKNQAILREVARRCNIGSNEFGVPFLYNPLTSSGQADRCYTGDINIIDFFRNLSERPSN